MMETSKGGVAHVTFSEVLSALSHALDLTEGQAPGHTARSCLIGMRIARELGLGTEQSTALYYTLLLKDAGCSSNAARMASVFGADDQAVKPRMKLVDWHRGAHLAWATLRTAGLGGSWWDHVRSFIAIAKTENFTRDIIRIRCERGSQIALQLGFPEATAEGIRSLDEHWCGLGYPEGLAGERIPLLSRIANISQTVEVFHTEHDIDAAMRVARERSRSWFDPQMVDLVLSWQRDLGWWQMLRGPDVVDRAMEAEPSANPRAVDDAGLDTIAQAFADIVDAKSPYTYQHSRRVADYARRIATIRGESGEEQTRLFRAGLLHDIGKLGISSRILEKPGRLTDDEMRTVQRHPMSTLSILSRVSAFGDFAWTAALHHEKLDGSGYPYGLESAQLDRASRILVVADMYDALTADRPYRAGLTPDDALGILKSEAGTRVCAESVDALG